MRTVTRRGAKARPHIARTFGASGRGDLHRDAVLALSIPGTWRYLKSESAAFWLVNAYLFIEYVRPQSIYPAIDVLPWGQAVVLGCAGAHIAAGGRWQLRGMAGRGLLLFTGAVVLSCLTAFSPSTAWAALPDIYLEWLFIIFLVVNIVTTEKRFAVFTLLFILASYKMSQNATRTFIGRGGSFDRAGLQGAPGFFHNSGEFGIQMCVFLPIAIAFIWALRDRWPRWKELILVGGPVTALISISGSSSRGALLGLVALAAWWVFFVNRKYRARSLLAVLVFGALAWAVVPDGFRDRFEGAGSDDTSTQRLVRWSEGMEMAKRNPIFGVGFENWVVYHQRHFPPGVGSLLAHNIFIECVSQLGLVGLLAFLFLVFATFYTNAKTRALTRRSASDERFIEYMAYALDGALVAFLVTGSFITVLYYPYFWINLAMTMSLHAAANNKLARSQEGRLPSRGRGPAPSHARRQRA